jgi:hypothetical protein
MNLTIPKSANLGTATERDLQVAKLVHDAVMTLLNMPHPLPFSELRACIEYMPLAHIIEKG